MGMLILFVLGLASGVALTLFLQRRGSGGPHDLSAPPPAPSRALPRVAPQDIDEAEIIVLIRLGRKVEAIKRMRELTGASLAEAKNAVEALERQQP